MIIINILRILRATFAEAHKQREAAMRNYPHLRYE
jgi:hypothetical protein